MPNFFPFLTYVLVTTFTPGPNNVLSMSNAMRYGYRKTIPFLSGIFAGFLVVMLACGLLNITLSRLLPQAKFWLNLLGLLYMLYLAVHILLSKPENGSEQRSDMNSFRGGFMLQFLNLKVILYGVTVYSLFITKSIQNPAAVSLFAPLLAGVGYAATSCWALGGDLFRGFLQKYYRWFNWVMAGLLVYTAVAGFLSH